MLHALRHCACRWAMSRLDSARALRALRCPGQLGDAAPAQGRGECVSKETREQSPVDVYNAALPDASTLKQVD